MSNIPFRKGKLIDYCKLNSASRGSRKLVTPWKSFVQTKSTEKASSLLGEELDIIVLSEASQIKREPYERMLRARIGPRNGKIMAISTPNSDSGLFVDLYERARNPEEKDWECWQFRTLDNPHFSEEEWETAKKELDEKVFAEQYEGKFVSRFGKVFLINEISYMQELPPGWEYFPVIFGVKPSSNNKYVVSKILFNNTNSTYIVSDEFYKQSATAMEAAEWIENNSRGQKMIGVVGGSENEYFHYELQKCGVNVYCPDERGISKEHRSVKRVQCLQNLLKHEPDRCARLFFLKDKVPNIIEEFKEATWQASREEKNRLDPELPHDLHMSAPFAVVNPLVFFENSRGIDIYAGQ